jgi:K+-sensing histidine kinase KdpD
LEIEAESRHEAERANEIKTRFLAMISHELRTPLTSIKGFTTTLLADDVTWEPEEQHDFIQTIQQETNRLQELIDHLLDLSRLEAGMLPIRCDPHALEDIMEDAAPQLQTLTSEHPLSIHLPPNLPRYGWMPGALPRYWSTWCGMLPCMRPKEQKSSSQPARGEVLCRSM